MNTPEQLKYALTTHEWVRTEQDGTVTIGITDHAQDALGDIVYVELPAVGTHFATGTEFGLIESVKTASDVYIPMSGTIVAVNTSLDEDPDIINDSPYDKGWLIRLKPDNLADVEGLRSAAQYQQSVQ